ncbi:MAG TPA: hypothetical protein VK279_02655 [Solirubrobacteraceae bacterium]|nr:hypothetical protein [Solirubrobacteraceae bacterium]
MAFLFVTALGRLIIGLATLAVVAAVMFFIVKPAVDDANKTVNQQIERVQPDIDRAERLQRRAERRQERGLDQAARAQDRADCILDAGADPDKIAACTD